MRYLVAVLCTVTLAAVFVPAFMGAESEEQGVREALGHYLMGQSTGDGDHYRRVFHPEAKLFAVREGEFWQLTSAEYAQRAPGAPAEDEAQRRRWIDMIDVAGNAAVAKVILDYPQVRYTDYFTLLKIDGTWMIVNKTFHMETK